MQDLKPQNNENILRESPKAHTLLIEQQKKISMTGVESVTSFSSKQIDLTVNDNAKKVKVTVSGDNLKITAFSKSSGAFTAIGDIFGVRYGRGGKFSGLFK
ncbi:MAG: YabP/YqfC family sporulation protein [Clostridia bacterium]|nr:YabP/YqfC family sporulation protein [Clostridia bacterium]